MSLSRKDRMGLAGIAVIAAVIVAAGAWFGLSGDKAFDKVTLCELGDRPRANRVVIVDKTDPLPPLALNNLKQAVIEQRDRLAIQDRLWVFLMGGDGINIADPLFSRCRPYAGRDVSSLDADPDRVEARYRTSFEAPLDTALKAALMPGTAADSPILETLGRVASSAAFSGTGPRHVVFVTDLLQHSSLFSAYGPAWAKRPNPRDLGEQLDQDYGRVFGNLDLTILVIDRHVPGTPNQRELRDYWRAFLKAAGVTDLVMRTL
jgi:hypothetical protein